MITPSRIDGRNVQPNLKPHDRKVTFACSMCDKLQTEIDVEFGCFVEIDVMTGKGCAAQVAVYRERPRHDDDYLYDVVCAQCGCSTGLELLEDEYTKYGVKTDN